MTSLSTIATIALETGISKEVLRKWEQRYGFPVPERDASGNRAYAGHQASRLRLIKRLLDMGMRPAQVVPLAEAELQALLQEQNGQPAAAPVDAAAVAELMAILHSRDRAAFVEKLRQEITRLGLEKFVLEVMCTLNSAVGEAWESGGIGIRDEHVYSDVMQSVVRQEISRISKPDGLPRMLITTPTGELHTLGILMADALASLHGANCISLGAQTPLEEIPHAVGDYRAGIVCLCFSAAFPKRRILPLLKELRNTVPRHVEIWIGGSGAVGLDRSPRGIKILTTLQDLIAAVSKYRRARARERLDGKLIDA